MPPPDAIWHLIEKIIPCIFFLFFYSCSKDSAINSDASDDINGKPHFTCFFLSKDNNPQLLENDTATIINDSTIILFCNQLERSDSLIPSFEGFYNSVRVNDEIQMSGRSMHDFNHVVRYNIFDDDGKVRVCNVIIKVLNNIPRIDINTEDNTNIMSTRTFVNAHIRISNTPENGVIDEQIKIRGRGNSSWNLPKKPYKIKFSKKQSPFGMPENKDWVLLANACDKSLLRTAYMCEVSRAVGIDYTVNYKYVDLFLNNDYLGTYLLTDQVEKSKNRIVVEKDGFLIEHDNTYKNEPLYFVTDIMKYGFTFKYPDADDGDIVKDDNNYVYIKSFLDNTEEALLKLNTNESSLEYTKYIDVNSFAKFYIAAELTANDDPNKFYVLPSRNAHLKMMPLWDAEWSMGLWPVELWWDKEVPDDMIKRDIWRNKYYFPYLFKSPLFVNEVKKEWENTRKNLPDVKKRISDICEEIKWTQNANFKKWPKMPRKTNVFFESWEDEVEYVNAFYDKRVDYLDSFLNSI